MIGSIIGGALKLGGHIAGGISASKAMKNVKKNLEGRIKENDDWFNRRYNEDLTQRADAQRLLNLTEENIRNRNRQAAGNAAVMGGTTESIAAAKAANNQALADVVGQIAATTGARKDAIESRYQAQDDLLNDNLNNMEVNKAKGIAAAAKGVGETGDKIANLF